jgi:hypothetical protein
LKEVLTGKEGLFTQNERIFPKEKLEVGLKKFLNMKTIRVKIE